MSAPPYMPLYVADYLGDTRHLSTEQHGAYLLILMAMWRAGGRLPNEAVKLARIAGLSPTRWAKLEVDVLGLFDVLGDEIGHKRVQKEFEKYTRTSAQRSEAGSRGGKAKALKSNDTALASATILPDQKAAISEPEPKIESPTPPNGGVAPQGAEAEHLSLFEVPAPEPEKPKAKRAKKLPEYPISPDWSPDADERTYAAEQGMNPEEIDREATNFRDYFLDAQERRPGWSRSWQRWCRTWAERRNRSPQVAPRARWSGGGGQSPGGFVGVIAKRRGFVPD